MKNLFFKHSLLFFALVLSSCGSMNKMGSKMAGDMIIESLPQSETEANWNYFKDSSLGNIKFVESLYFVNKTDTNLLYALTKSYGAYGLMVYETEWMNDEFASLEEINKSNAIAFYSKAIDYGLQFLEQKNISYDLLMEKQVNASDLHQLLDSKLNKNNRVDLEGIFFFAQSLGALINFHKDRPLLIAHIPMVKSLFDWVCAKEPNFYYGSCDLFYGMYETSRPTTLGGNPEKGKEYFLRAIKNNPLNLYLQVAYAQYYLIPMGEKKEFDAMKDDLSNELNDFAGTLVWAPPLAEKNKYASSPHLNLFNATASKRWQILRKYEKKLF